MTKADDDNVWIISPSVARVIFLGCNPKDEDRNRSGHRQSNLTAKIHDRARSHQDCLGEKQKPMGQARSRRHPCIYNSQSQQTTCVGFHKQCLLFVGPAQALATMPKPSDPERSGQKPIEARRWKMCRLFRRGSSIKPENGFGSSDLRPDFPPVMGRVLGLMLRDHSLDRPRVEFSGIGHGSGLGALPGFCNRIGGLLPIAP